MEEHHALRSGGGSMSKRHGTDKRSRKKKEFDKYLREIEAFIQDRNYMDALVSGELLFATALEEHETDIAGEALFYCGFARAELNDTEGAIAAYKRAVETGYKRVGLYYNLANLERETMNTTEAIGYYEDALRLNPKHGPSMNNIALALEDAGRRDIAEEYYLKAIEYLPEGEQARTNIAYTLLRRGRYREGWKIYEQRPGISRITGIEPTWKPGESLRGKDVLVMVEQGYGDVIMFAGLLQEIKKECKSITLLCDRRLEPILKRSLKGIRATSRLEAEEIGACQAILGIASLGYICRNTKGKSIKPVKPYVVARESSRFNNTSTSRLCVGIAWRGGGELRTKERRSLSLEAFYPLLKEQGIDWVNLQYGETRLEIEKAHENLGIQISCEFNEKNDMEVFCEQVERVDVVVTVQQTAVHFGGAMGKKTLALVPKVPEWRYGTSGNRMAWWESVEIIRQDCFGSWDKEIEAIRRRLKQLRDEKSEQYNTDYLKRSGTRF